MYSYEYIDNFLDMLKNCEPDEYELIKSKMRSNEYIDNYTILNRNKHRGIKISVDLKFNEYKRALYDEKDVADIQNSENNNCERHEVNDQFWKLSIAVFQPSSANEMNIKHTLKY